MARALQRFSVRTAIPAGDYVAGERNPADGATFVIRLSLDSSDDLPREKAA